MKLAGGSPGTGREASGNNNNNNNNRGGRGGRGRYVRHQGTPKAQAPTKPFKGASPELAGNVFELVGGTQQTNMYKDTLDAIVNFVGRTFIKGVDIAKCIN
ncbi:MAG: hypothetical protein ACRCT2_17270, partial [Plesiomonas shigelloides]